MSSSRIVSVFGATGLQGSAVIKMLLKDGTFTPRAISRNPESDASLKLKARGVEVVKGDSGDKPSLVDALRGSEAVFAEVGVKFFIFSSLPSITKLSGGKYQNVVHYEDKAAVEEYLKSSGLLNASLLLGGFLEGYWRSHLLHKTATGFDFGVPSFTATDREAFTWVERDVPAAALALLKNYTDQSKNISGKSYPVVTTLSYTELVAKTAKVLDAEVTFTTRPNFGLLPVDEMFAAHAEYSGLYTAEPEPNPDLQVP
ncbi:hypothetical protein B0H17DRAFT_1326448 [Mycena rosella]|uniref:NmrA-like domain-containing protein n=1 Tax=Mycena rosella TaxID=1033263 RepID=A0AAD7GTR5_MYCRO|nr:hypothetical protein B0H17DRAFT_1326448 [Mycena rosella]